MLYGIYIAKFKNSVYDQKTYGKDILGSYVIGQTKLNAKTYKNFDDVESVVRDRIQDEAGKYRSKKGFARELKSWDDDVLDFDCLTFELEKGNADDYIRRKLENYNVGFQVQDTEFFKTDKSAKELKDIILSWNINPFNFYRNLKYEQNGFRREIIDKSKEVLKKYHEVLLYLFCRVGKSAISLQIAKEITKTNHILIVTAFPNAKNSFKEYTINHINMMDYNFIDKDNLREFKAEDHTVVFLSTAALRVREDEDIESIDDIDKEDKNKVYKRIYQLKKVGFNPDVLIIDETHNGISSPNTAKVINELKKDFGIENIIHNSATPFNDFKSGRFKKEQTIQYDFLTLKTNGYVNYPNLEMVSLPFFNEEKDLVKILTNPKIKGNHKLLFMENVVDAKSFVENYKDVFAKKKIEIEYIDELDGTTTEDRTNKFQEKFKKTIVVTVDKLTTGVTLPLTDAVVLDKDIKSAERLVQIMSRPLTGQKGKDNVYFYTIGSNNIYIATNELKRSYHIAQDVQEWEGFNNFVKKGYLKISEASFKEGDDLSIHELGIDEVMENVREWSVKLSDISNRLIIDIDVTKKQLEGFDLFNPSGQVKAFNSLKLIAEEGTRKIKDVQNKVTADFCQKLKDSILKDGSKIEKKGIEKDDISVQELVRMWFMNIMNSLNTWLLTKEISSFKEIPQYVISKYNLTNEVEIATFKKILFDNENLIKSRIIDFNGVFEKFQSDTVTLKEQSLKSNLLRDLLKPEVNKLVQNNKAGAGYPNELLKDITESLNLNSKSIGLLDDLDLNLTNYLINTLKINESYIYLICSSKESFDIMQKAYNIQKEHLVLLVDVIGDQKKK